MTYLVGRKSIPRSKNTCIHTKHDGNVRPLDMQHHFRKDLLQPVYCTACSIGHTTPSCSYHRMVDKYHYSDMQSILKTYMNITSLF